MLRHFFATANDLLPVFDRVDSKQSLAYTLTGLLESPNLTIVAKGQDLPTLRAIGTLLNAIGGPSYLVTPANVAVHVRKVPQNDGGTRYAVDQLINPDSIILSHGGFFNSEILLDGRVGTCSDSAIAEALFRAYANAIAKHFVRIKAFWVGPQAAELLRQGCRLTGGADSSKEYDLVP
jgi:hypothetical protein